MFENRLCYLQTFKCRNITLLRKFYLSDFCLKVYNIVKQIDMPSLKIIRLILLLLFPLQATFAQNKSKLAKQIDVSEDWLKHNRASNNPLPFYRLGHLIRYHNNEVSTWFEKNLKEKCCHAQHRQWIFVYVVYDISLFVLIIISNFLITPPYCINKLITKLFHAFKIVHLGGVPVPAANDERFSF